MTEKQPRRLTEAHRANIRRGTQKTLSTPEMHNRLSLIQAAVWKSPERRKTQSQRQIELWQNPEHREKKRISHLGIKNKPETRRKISKALKGRPSPLRGREMPQAHRAKIAHSRKEQYVDLDLFKIGKNANILASIFNEGEIETLERYFKSKKIKREPGERVSSLLDMLSIAVARLA